MVSEAARDWRSCSTIKVEQAGVILGISRATAYEAAQSGQIPTLRIGRRLLVPTHALRRMLGEIPSNENEAPGGNGDLVKNAGAGGGRDTV